MGVYRKVGEVNGEDQYRQLDSRGPGHVLHLQFKRGLETDQFQWQIEKPCSWDHNGEMRKRVDPTDTSLFSNSNTSYLSPLFSDWMFNSSKPGEAGKTLIADEDCKVARFSPFLHGRCSRITIKTSNGESGGGMSIYRVSQKTLTSEDSETHPDLILSAIIEGIMAVSNIEAFFGDTLYIFALYVFAIFFHFSVQVFTCRPLSSVPGGWCSLTQGPVVACTCLSILRLESGR